MKFEEETVLLCTEAGDLVTEDMEYAEVPGAFLSGLRFQQQVLPSGLPFP